MLIIVLNSCLNRVMSNLALLLLGSVAMVEIAESGDGQPVDEDERMNANYHGKGSQLCYCLPLLYVCTLHQYQNEQQKTTGSITGAWLSGLLCSVY